MKKHLPLSLLITLLFSVYAQAESGNSCVKATPTWTKSSRGSGTNLTCFWHYDVQCIGTKDGKPDMQMCAQYSFSGDSSLSAHASCSAPVHTTTTQGGNTVNVNVPPKCECTWNEPKASDITRKCDCAKGVANCTSN